MANLVGYARVSSDGQRDNTSLSTQKEGIERYCETHGHKLVGFFQDVESGANLETRESLMWALEQLPSVDGLVVYRLDRLTRSVFDAERLKRSFKKQKKLLLSVCESANIETDEGDFIFTITSAINQLERKRILTRAQQGLDKKKEKREYYGGSPPYGWASLNGSLVELPHEQAICAQIRELYFHRGWPIAHIVKDLNARGVPSKRRGNWNATTVRRIISGDGDIVDKLRESGNILPAQVWEEYANGKQAQRNSS